MLIELRNFRLDPIRICASASSNCFAALLSGAATWACLASLAYAEEQVVKPVRYEGSIVIESVPPRFECSSWSPPAGFHPREIVARGDFNSDGLRDAVGYGMSSGWVAYGRDSGGMEVRAWDSGRRPPAPTQITVGDLNGDHVDDLLYFVEGDLCFHRAFGGENGLSTGKRATEWCVSFNPQTVAAAGIDSFATGPLILIRDDAHELHHLAFSALDAPLTENFKRPLLPDALKTYGADIDGDLETEVLQYVSSFNAYYAEKKEALEWASLPPGNWSPPIMLDYNGDRAIDMLFTDASISGVILARATGPTSREYSLTLRGCEGTPIAAVDDDGDGRDEIVLENSAGLLFLARPRFDVPTSPLIVQSQSGREGSVGSQGAFSIEVPTSSVDALYVAGPDNYFPAPALVIQPERSRGRKVTLVGFRKEDGYSLPTLTPHPIPPHRACIGYNRVEHRMMRKWGRIDGYCPSDSAIVEADDFGAVSGSSRLQGLCCPLPEDAVFTDKELFVSGTCPDGYLLIGTDVTRSEREDRYICRKIDESKWVLGPPEKGRYWGTGWSMRGAPRPMTPDQLPPGLASGIGRLGLNRWDTDGCIGEHPGDLLVSITGDRCTDMIFRPLLKRDGMKRIVIGSECRGRVNPFEPSGRCKDK